MFSFSASESIIAEFPDTKYTYYDQEEKKVRAGGRQASHARVAHCRSNYPS